jgi:hypothetical protein
MSDAPTEVFPAVPADDAPAPDAAAPAEDLSAKAADLERQLEQVRAANRPVAVIRLKVEEPYVGFALGHINVGTEFTDVPVSSVAALMEGAANSGVTLTQEEG